MTNQQPILALGLEQELEEAIANNIPTIQVLEKILDEQILKEAKKERERKHWHASDLGACPSGVYYDRLYGKKDVEIDLRGSRVMGLGGIIHTELERQYTDTPYYVAGEEDLEIIDLELDASGHPDMLLKIGKYHLLVDIKSVHSKKFWYQSKQGFEADFHHRQQLHFYYDHLKAKYPNMVMIVFYYSKDDSMLRECLVPYDPKITESNYFFFKALKEAWGKKVPPIPAPDVIYDEDKKRYQVNWQAKYCKYHHLCTGKANWLELAEQEVKDKNLATLD